MPRTTITPDAMPHSVLPTVFDHPRDSGEDDDFHVPLLMYTAPPCDYKRRRQASFKGGRSGHSGQCCDHRHTLSTTEHPPQSTSPLAETWELPSLSRHACIPLLQAPPVQDNTVPSHTPLLDVRPRGRNQDKLMHSCVTSCINHLG